MVDLQEKIELLSLIKSLQINVVVRQVGSDFIEVVDASQVDDEYITVAEI